MTKGPFRADHVGSMIRPDRLLDARAKQRAKKISAAALRAIEDSCIAEVVKMQENAGLHAVTDGEFRRGSWSRDFLTSFDNVVPTEGKLDVHFKNPDGTLNSNKPSSMKVTGRLQRPKPIQLVDYRFLHSVATTQAKVCIPSPTLMHFRGGREDVDRAAYPDMPAFFDDLARVYAEEIDELVANGLQYLQIDDVNLAYLCDDNFRLAVKQIGEDADTLIDTYIDLINASIAHVPDDVTVSIHLCRGNGQTGGVAQGGYEPIAEALLGRLDVDGFFLEYDDERSGDFAPLRFLPKGKTVVLGLMSTKKADLESTAALTLRIDQAAKIIPLDQLAISPQCGFSAGARETARERPVSIETEQRKLARLVETAIEVWGQI